MREKNELVLERISHPPKLACCFFHSEEQGQGMMEKAAVLRAVNLWEGKREREEQREKKQKTDRWRGRK
jgi:hypothetical protein